MNTEIEDTKNVAFLCPGQGSQSVGMLKAFADLPQYKQMLEQASDALGFNLGKLIEEGPESELNLTVNTQPAILAASYLIYTCYKDWGGADPQVFAGHSLGEYSALVCAGAIEFETALRLVRYRAQVMQDAVPLGVGGMVAVLGLADDLVEQGCEQAREFGVVEAVNFNMPGQVVIAGHAEAVKKAGEYCKALGAKRAIALRVSGPFHSSLLQPATEKMREYLSGVDIRVPKIPVIHNVGVEELDSAEKMKAALAKQVSSPVNWVKTLNLLQQRGVNLYCECGPGAVLTTIATRSIPGVRAKAMNTPDAIKQIIEGV